jgi:hypothetical protein
MKKVYISIQDQLNKRLVQLDQIADCLQPLLKTPDPNRIWPLIQRRTLILMTDDVVVATQARFLQRNICRHLNRELELDITQVDIRLISLPLKLPAKTTTRFKVSTKTMHVMKSIASDIPDPELSLALGSLAESLTDRTKQPALIC